MEPRATSVIGKEPQRDQGAVAAVLPESYKPTNRQSHSPPKKSPNQRRKRRKTPNLRQQSWNLGARRD